MRFVTLVDDERPILRVDVYADESHSFAFEDAVVWRGNLIIGFGNQVHAIDLASQSALTVSLAHYFGHFYPTLDYLLIASGERLFRMQPNRSILWKTEAIAVDGVVVHDPGPPFIRGDAELDPPGGWKPFTLSATDGCLIAPV